MTTSVRITAPLGSSGAFGGELGSGSSVGSQLLQGSDFRSLMEEESQQSFDEGGASFADSRPNPEPARPMPTPQSLSLSFRAMSFGTANRFPQPTPTEGQRQPESQPSPNTWAAAPEPAPPEPQKPPASQGPDAANSDTQKQDGHQSSPPADAQATTDASTDNSTQTQSSASLQDERGSHDSPSYGIAAQANPGAQSSAILVSQLAMTAERSLLKVGSGQGDSKARQGATASGTGDQGDLLALNLSALESGLEATESAAVAGRGDAGGAHGSGQPNAASDLSPQSGDPKIDASTSASASSGGMIAFEAKLTQMQDSAGGGDGGAQQHSQTADQLLPKQSLGWSPSDADATSASGDANPKVETALTAMPTPAPAASAATQPHPQAATTTAAGDISAAARMQTLMEPAAQPAGPHNSITVKVPGTASDAGIDLRFVDRGGNIHLSVRTPSAEVAQELRGGLNDLVGKLEHAGIRAEVSSPAANESGNQSPNNQSKDNRDSQDGSADRRGSGRDQADSQSQQQDSRGPDRSRWMEALEGSTPDQTQSSFPSKEQRI